MSGPNLPAIDNVYHDDPADDLPKVWRDEAKSIGRELAEEHIKSFNQRHRPVAPWTEKWLVGFPRKLRIDKDDGPDTVEVKMELRESFVAVVNNTARAIVDEERS